MSSSLNSTKNNNNGEIKPGKANEETRYADGSLRLRNPHISDMDEDFLYHLALGSQSHNLEEMFGDVKFVCMGGSAKRMEDFAEYILKEIGHKLPIGTKLMDISQYSYRYCTYKVGPVLSVSHGMGSASIGILLHEIIKLMYHAKCKDPIFFRIGTSGGIGLKKGTVVISDAAADGMFNKYYQLPILAKMVKRPAKFDLQFIGELKALARADDPFDVVTGTTMCAEDFYEGQGRIDGAFCEYTEEDKMNYLRLLQENGIKNIEMEATVFAAMTHYAGIKAAIVCATLVDRMEGDQVTTPKPTLNEWQLRPQILVGRYIKKYLQGQDS